MGIAVKYVIKPPQFGELGTEDRLLPTEETFYANLASKIYLTQFRGDAAAREIWNSVRSFWETCITTPDDIGEFLDKDFVGLAEVDDRLLIDRETAIFHVRGAAAQRNTLSVRISTNVCSISGATAFAIYDYAWEFTGKDSNSRQREDGKYAQTFVRNEQVWLLLGSVGGPFGPLMPAS